MTAPTSETAITTDTAGTTLACEATSAGGEFSQALTIKRDTTAPTVSCDRPDSDWHAADVSLACTAADSGSGLADAADADFSLGKLIAVAALRCDGYSAKARLSAAGAVTLSRARAAAMCAALRRFGVRAPAGVVGHGDAEPLAANTSESGRAQNRRVEVTITHRLRRL